jgi:hypothetical protein
MTKRRREKEERGRTDIAEKHVLLCCAPGGPFFTVLLLFAVASKLMMWFPRLSVAVAADSRSCSCCCCDEWRRMQIKETDRGERQKPTDGADRESSNMKLVDKNKRWTVGANKRDRNIRKIVETDRGDRVEGIGRGERLQCRRRR